MLHTMTEYDTDTTLWAFADILRVLSKSTPEREIQDICIRWYRAYTGTTPSLAINDILSEAAGVPIYVGDSTKSEEDSLDEAAAIIYEERKGTSKEVTIKQARIIAQIKQDETLGTIPYQT